MAKQTRLPLGDTPTRIDCDVDIVAVSKIKWEASCPCGWWFQGTKAECERRSFGHPPRRELTDR